MKCDPVISRVSTLDAKIFTDVSRLWMESGVGNPERGDNFEVVERSLKHGGLLLMAYQNDLAIGTLWLTHDYRRVYIHHMAVKPEHQNRGIGKALLKEAIDVANEIGYQAKLEVHIDNPAARKIYTEAGFKYLDGYLLMIKRT